MLLKNSARDSRKLKPRWKGTYKVHADLGTGVYTLYNEKTGKVLKKAVNISRLTEFHHNCPKSPEKRRLNNPQYPCQQIYHQKIMLTVYQK